MNLQLLPESLNIPRVQPRDSPTCGVPMDMDGSCMQKALQDQAEQLETLILHDRAEHPAEKGFVKGTL